VLQAGGASGLSSQKIDVGYLPTVNAPPPAAGAVVGQNPLPGYDLTALYEWGLSYYPYNFRNNTYRRFIFNQLYFREALQHLVDQEGVINGPLHGYGKVTVGPVGNYPVTKYLSPELRKIGDNFPLSLGTARHLLTSHGWTIPASGPATCTKPGTASTDCGAGIKLGDKLDFSLIYATGFDWIESSIKELVSNASLVGIDITATGEGFNQLIGQVVNCTTVSGPQCGWQLADWGSWSYAPDYLPTGEELFGSTSGANYGGYNNPKNDQLINKTLRTGNLPTLYAWENYLASQLPVVWTPDAPAYLLETADNLHIGVQAPTLNLTPEDWYYVK
jgi:peptide/nickel transport system substrate-binding protein